MNDSEEWGGMSGCCNVKCTLPPGITLDDLRKVKTSKAVVRKSSVPESKRRRTVKSTLPSTPAVQSTKAPSVKSSVNSSKAPALCKCCEDSLCPCCKKGFGQKQFEEYGIPQKENKKNKVLTRELPLYDDNFHLLGYLPEGTIIKGPYCLKSHDPFIEDVNKDERTESKPNKERACPPECKEAAMEGKFAVPFPRWVNRKQYDNATRNI